MFQEKKTSGVDFTPLFKLEYFSLFCFKIVRACQVHTEENGLETISQIWLKIYSHFILATAWFGTRPSYPLGYFSWFSFAPLKNVIFNFEWVKNVFFQIISYKSLMNHSASLRYTNWVPCGKKTHKNCIRLEMWYMKNMPHDIIYLN